MDTWTFLDKKKKIKIKKFNFFFFHFFFCNYFNYKLKQKQYCLNFLNIQSIYSPKCKFY